MTQAVEELHKIDNRIKLNPNVIADRILQEHRLIYSASEFYEYMNGVYRQIADDVIIGYIKNILGTLFSIKFKNEVLNSIKASSYIDIRFLNNTRCLNLKNGLFDMETRHLMPHSPDVFSTIQLQVSYNAESTCPKWRTAVSEIFEGNTDKVNMLQEFFGLCLTKETKYCKALFMLGEGRNGKSTVLYILENLVGEDNRVSIPLELLEDTHYIANFLNKLVNISVETNSKSEVYDSRFKQIVSGDSITADRKYGQQFTFRPYCKLIYALNNMPRVNDKTDAYFRRLLILKFSRQFSGDGDNKGLKYELMEELDGIFLWCLEGYERLKMRNDFSVTKEMQEEVDEHRRENNNVIVFIDEACELGPTRIVSKDMLYQKYKQWCKENNHQALSKIRFGKEALRHYGFKNIQSSNERTRTRMWEGVALKIEESKPIYERDEQNEQEF